MRGNFNNPFQSKSGPRSLAGEATKLQLRKGGKTAELTQQEKFKALLEAKKAALGMKAAAGSNASKFQLPGTKSSDDKPREMSKSFKKLMAIMELKKARKETKKVNDAVVIKSRYFNGGQVDKNGKVLDVNGKIIGTVDLKTGNIKNAWGMTIGKYKDDSFGNYKVQRFIDKENSAPKSGGADSGGGFWGVGAPDSGKDDGGW